MTIVNKVTEIVLPALAENLIFHAKQWDEHMRKHHTPREYEEWKAQVRAYMSERGVRTIMTEDTTSLFVYSGVRK